MLVSLQHGCSSWCLSPASARIVRSKQQMQGPPQSASGHVVYPEKAVFFPTFPLALWASARAHTGSGPGLLMVCLQCGLRSSWFTVLGILSFPSGPLIVKPCPEKMGRMAGLGPHSSALRWCKVPGRKGPGFHAFCMLNIFPSSNWKAWS